MIEIPVSLGELVDKLTILKIKQTEIRDSKKLAAVEKELMLLEEKYKTFQSKEIDNLMEVLYDVNRNLWEIEDAIRLKEKAREFDDEFITLARAVYKTNDNRAGIKNDINVLSNSKLMEVKSYEQYE